MPIRIHELDAHDKKIIEAELGPLRAIDFTYQSAGVNRPLRPKDDESSKGSQNVYRDQVNKTANAIKEIINGLQGKSTLDNEKNLKGETSTNTLKNELAGEVKRNRKLRLPSFSQRSLLTFGFVLSSISLIAVLLFHFSQPAQETRTYNATLLPPDKIHFEVTVRNNFALSPNGRTLAFVAADSVGKTSLWVRQLNATNAQLLMGTEGAYLPFWSPDSRFIGFFATGKLRKIEAAGGVPQTVCDVGDQARGGTWSKEGAIIFSGNTATFLSIVFSSRGSVTNVTKLDSSRKEAGHRWPLFLPDGKHFLYLSRLNGGSVNEGDGIFLASIDTTVAPRLIVRASSNMVLANDYLLFANRNKLMAQPFDEASLQTTGEAFPLSTELVNFTSYASNAGFTASQNGTLVYQAGESGSSGIKLVWHDRTGKQTGTVGSEDSFFGLRLSPEGKRIAASFPDIKTGNVDTWLYDIDRPLWTRFTFHDGPDRNAIWSPDGRIIVFASSRNTSFDLHIRAANGEASEELLFESTQDKYPSGWSRDGKFLAFDSDVGENKFDIWIMPMRTAAGERKPFVFLKTEFNESRATFSPDCRWIAYESDESGRSEIYIRPFPGPGGKWQVSPAGGSRPRWRGDGKELFFLSGDFKMMSAEVRSGTSAVEIVSVKPLFQIGNLLHGTRSLYDVTADGQRFLVETIQGNENSAPLTLVVNWPGEVKKK